MQEETFSRIQKKLSQYFFMAQLHEGRLNFNVKCKKSGFAYESIINAKSLTKCAGGLFQNIEALYFFLKTNQKQSDLIHVSPFGSIQIRVSNKVGSRQKVSTILIPTQMCNPSTSDFVLYTSQLRKEILEMKRTMENNREEVGETIMRERAQIDFLKTKFDKLKKQFQKQSEQCTSLNQQLTKQNKKNQELRKRIKFLEKQKNPIQKQSEKHNNPMKFPKELQKEDDSDLIIQRSLSSQEYPSFVKLEYQQEQNQGKPRKRVKTSSESPSRVKRLQMLSKENKFRMNQNSEIQMIKQTTNGAQILLSQLSLPKSGQFFYEVELTQTKNSRLGCGIISQQYMKNIQRRGKQLSPEQWKNHSITYIFCSGWILSMGQKINGGKKVNSGAKIKVLLDAGKRTITWLQGSEQLAQHKISSNLKGKLYVLVCMSQKGDKIKVIDE